jgi:hypothetical protein
VLSLLQSALEEWIETRQPEAIIPADGAARGRRTGGAIRRT